MTDHVIVTVLLRMYHLQQLAGRIRVQFSYLLKITAVISDLYTRRAFV